jgi:AcrR family transcriptional regulator
MSDARPSVPASRVPSRRREVTRERVLDAARDVFAERGVYGGTIEEICARAGFTRGAFYSNFTGKDDVLRALVAREHARLLAHLDARFGMVGAVAAGAASADPRVTLASIADGLLRSVPLDRQFSLITQELEIHAIREPAVAQAFLDADARFRERIAGFLERGLRELGREPVIDVADAADVAIAIVERSMRRALLDQRGGTAGGADAHAFARTTLSAAMVALSRPIGPAPEA